VRFGISHVLDAIEKKLTTDPAAASAVLDLAEVVRMADLDGGRPAQLIRLGLVVDAVARHLGDGGASVYTVADRALLSDIDLTANEKIVIRRWSDDGKIEVIGTGGPPATARTREIAALSGLPLVTRSTGGYPGLAYGPVAHAGGVALRALSGGPGPHAPAAVLGRRWRCPETQCPSFAGTERRGQPPAHLGGGVPRCARHGAPLADLGPVPRSLALAVRVKGVVWHRFLVTEGGPVVIGRSPEESTGIGIGLALDEAGLRWVSRNHVRLELRGTALTVTDTSTNGTVLLGRDGPAQEPRRSPLGRGDSAPLGEWDRVELYGELEVGWATRSVGPVPEGPAGSVMAEAPTQAMRLPGPG